MNKIENRINRRVLQGSGGVAVYPVNPPSNPVNPV